MGRKPNATAAENIGGKGEEEKKETVETTDTEKAETEKASDSAAQETDSTEKPETEKAESKKKEKPIADDEIVKIFNESVAGKKVCGTTGKVYEFDEKGFAEIPGVEARYLLTVPGYSRK